MIEARRAELGYVEAEFDDFRKRRLDVTVLVVTLLVVSLTLIFAFLSATLREVSEGSAKSLFGISDYWWFYSVLLAGIVFIPLVLYLVSRRATRKIAAEYREMMEATPSAGAAARAPGPARP
jgi:hypothetical protein